MISFERSADLSMIPGIYRLTLLGLLLLLLGGGLGGTSGSGGSTGRSGGGGTTRRDGSELGRTLSDQLRKGKGWRRGIIVHIIIKRNINTTPSRHPNTQPTVLVCIRGDWRPQTDLVDILALELGDELLNSARVDLGTGSLEDRGDVGSGRGGLSTELEEEVGGDVLHSV